MNTNTGDIAYFTVLREELTKQGVTEAKIEAALKQIDPANLSRRAQAELRRVGRTKVSRNSLCPCGSGKKFKRCCMTT